MPPKKEKPQDKKQKQGQNQLSSSQVNLKDLVPSDLKQNPREPKVGHQQIDDSNNENMKPNRQFMSHDQPEQWPGDEQAMNYDYGNNGDINIYIDEFKPQLNHSFGDDDGQMIFWRRPRDYLVDALIEEEQDQKNKDENQSNSKWKQIKSFMGSSKQVDSHDLSSRFRNNMAINRICKQKRLSVQVQPSKTDFIVDDSSPMMKRTRSPKQKLIDDQPYIDRLKVFSTKTRPETEEEKEYRKQQEIQQQQQQQNKQKKQEQKKKQDEVKEEEEEEIRQIEEVRMSNIDLKDVDDLPELSKWIASIFQAIRDRNIVDSFNSEPLNHKIYPQSQNKIPQYSQSGKYWVKLYFMGQQVKVEIDDKLPCSTESRYSLFPKSVDSSELWPMLFTKALLKLQQQYIYDKVVSEQSFGQTWILYSLMGLVPQQVDVHSLQDQDWKYIQQQISDDKYNHKNCYVLFYCRNDFIPKLKSNMIGKKNDNMIGGNNSNSSRKYSKTQTKSMLVSTVSALQSNLVSQQSLPIQQQQQQQQQQVLSDNKQLIKKLDEDGKLHIQYKPNYTQRGYVYSVIDSLFNGQFNMVYVKEKSEEELKLKESYFNIGKMNMHKMTKEAKLDIRRQKKEMKERIQQEEKKRIDLIMKPPIQYRMLKVRTGAQQIPLLNYFCTFSEKEIYIAKKCITNRLSCPPNYDMPDIKGDNMSMQSQSMSQMIETSFQVKPLDDFGGLPNLVEPMKRQKNGGWVMEQDLSNVFNKCLFYYDMNKLKHYQNVDYSGENEILLIKKDDDSQSSNKTIELIISFMGRRSSNRHIDPCPYFYVSRFDYQQFRELSKLRTLSDGLIDSSLVKLENKNHVFRLNSFSPIDYHLQIGCDNEFSIMNETQYLVDYENYKHKVMNIEYQYLDKQTYILMAKYTISIQEVDTMQILFRIKQNQHNIEQCQSHVLVDHLRIKIIEIYEDDQQNSQQNVNLEDIEGVNRIMNEQQYVNIKQLNRHNLNINSHYVLVVEGQFDQIINETNSTSIDLEVLYQSDSESHLQIEQIELNEVQEYNDRYVNNKYGFIFRERLFIQDNPNNSQLGNNLSFQFRLSQFINKQSQQNQESQQQKGNKNTKQQQQQQQSDEQLEEIDMNTNRLIYVKLMEMVGQGNNGWDVQLSEIVKVVGNNQVLISNVQLYQNRKYYLIAGMEGEQQEQQVVPDQQDQIMWNLRVYSGVDNNIAIVKDISKEQYENSIRKQWEDNQQGRGEKAIKERKKYLLKQKQKEGQQLNEDELMIVNESRKIQKKDEIEDNKVDQKKKDTKGKKQQQQKKEEDKQIVEQKQEIKVMAKSDEHRMDEIVGFIEQMEQNRMRDERPIHQGMVGLRTEEQMRELKQTINMEQEQFRNIIIEQQSRRVNLIKQQEDIDQGVIEYTVLEDMLSKRDQLRKQFINKKEKETKLIELCLNQGNYEEIEKVYNEVMAVKNVDQQLLHLAQKSIMNGKINQILDELNNAICGFDVDKINDCLDNIQKYQIDCEKDLLEKAVEIQEEAKENPNYIAEKQAEMKKSGKKGKK